MNIDIFQKYALILQAFCNENMERASGFFEKKKSMKISRQGIMSSKSNNQTTANG